MPFSFYWLALNHQKVLLHAIAHLKNVTGAKGQRIPGAEDAVAEPDIDQGEDGRYERHKANGLWRQQRRADIVVIVGSPCCRLRRKLGRL